MQQPKGSAFANDDLDHYKFVLGEHKVVVGMCVYVFFSILVST